MKEGCACSIYLRHQNRVLAWLTWVGVYACVAVYACTRCTHVLRAKCMAHEKYKDIHIYARMNVCPCLLRDRAPIYYLHTHFERLPFIRFLLSALNRILTLHKLPPNRLDALLLILRQSDSSLDVQK